MSKAQVTVQIKLKGKRTKQKTFKLEHGDFLLIGCLPNADIRLEGEGIPERFLYLLLGNDGRVVTTINGSEPPVLLDEQKLSGMQLLKPGSVMDIAGVASFTFTELHPAG